MSKNLKKAISLLLTIGILSSSAAITAFAEDAPASADAAVTATAAPDASAEPDASAAPEESAAPAESAAPEAPTQAPVVQGPTDSYYDEAVGLVTALKIVQGYEDGSIKPENTITRAEVATMILRMMGIDVMAAAYTNIFTDVDASHWAANNIQTAFDMGIINGMGDGTFAPDAEVTYAQAVKMLVCALKYDNLAMNMGGFPSGYLTAASQKNIEITKNADGFDGNTPATRGVVIKMIYNTLNALYPKGSGLTGDGVKFSTEAGKTLASELLEIYSVEGIITATNTTSIDSAADPAPDQILIDGELYYKGDFDADKYVGYKVKAYYREHDENGIKDIVYVVPKAKQEVLTINAEDVDKIEDIRSDSGKIYYFNNKSSSKTKVIKCKSPVIVYNGKILAASDVPRGYTFEEFINPEIGSITLNDFDNDGSFDVMFVESYKTFVVTSASDSTINAKYAVDGKQKIDVDMEENDDLMVKIEKNGDEITSKKLKKWDVITVLESANQTGDRIVSIIASDATVEGKVDSIDGVFGNKDYKYDSDDEWNVEIDGKEYEVDRTFALSGDIKIGTEGTFHLDSLGRIAAVEGAAGSKLSSSEEYGWLMWIKQLSGAGDKKIKIFTQSGDAKEFDIASSLSLFGPDKSTAVASLEMEWNQQDSGFKWNYDWDITALKNADWTNEVVLDVEDKDDWKQLLMAEDIMEYNTAGGNQMKLVKYSVNGKGEIKSIAMPVLVSEANYTYEDDDRPVVLNANMNGRLGSGSLLGNKYLLPAEMLQIQAPRNLKDVTDKAAYKYEKIESSRYINREGVSVDYFLAEFDGTKPSLVIRYENASDAPSNYYYNSADDAGLMMISKIQTVFDEELDEECYKITGYANGNKLTYTTSKTTSVGLITGFDRDYPVAKLWSGASSEYDNPIAAPQFKDIKSALKPGDIVGVKATGTRLDTVIKFLDCERAQKFDFGVISGIFGSYNLPSRDGLAAGMVTDIDTDEAVTVVITDMNGDSSSVSVDPGYYVDVYNVKTGEVEEGKTVSELELYDPSTGTGDILFARIFRMGTRELYAIRFE